MWCGYPRVREGFSPFEHSRFWMCLDPGAIANFDDLIVTKIKEERARLPGSMGVIGTCSSTFSGQSSHFSLWKRILLQHDSQWND